VVIQSRTGPQYFETLGIPLIRGRDFSDLMDDFRRALDKAGVP